jgi:hypothetical protein
VQIYNLMRHNHITKARRQKLRLFMAQKH